MPNVRDDNHAGPTRSGRVAGRHVAWSLVGSVLFFVAGLAWTLCVPRLMGPTDYGALVVLVSMVEITGVIASLGTSSALAKYFPLIVREAGEHLFDRLASSYLTVVGIVSVASASIGLLLAQKLQAINLSVSMASAAACCTVMYGLFLSVNGYLYGKARVREASLWRAARPALAVVLVLSLYQVASVFGALCGLAIALSLCIVGMLWTLRPLALPEFDRTTLPRLRELTRFGALAMFTPLTATAMMRSGNIVLALVDRTTNEVALYALAVNLVFQAPLLLSAFATGLVPSVSALVAQEDFGRARQWIVRCAKYQMTACIIFIAGVVLVGKPLLDLVFGAKYVGLWGVALITAPAAICLLLQGLVTEMATPFGKPHLGLEVGVVSIVALAGGVIWLGGAFGAVGGAWAFLGATGVGAVYALARFWKLTGIMIVDLKTFCVLLMGLPLVFFKCLLVTSWWGAAVFAGFTAYLCAMLFAGKFVTRAELRQITSVLRKREPPTTPLSTG